MWQRGPAGAAVERRGPGRGIPRVVTCTWRGYARASVSRFGSEVLRVNPWILFVSRLGNLFGAMQSPTISRHIITGIVHRDGNDREILDVAVRCGSSI